MVAPSIICRACDSRFEIGRIEKRAYLETLPPPPPSLPQVARRTDERVGFLNFDAPMSISGELFRFETRHREERKKVGKVGND